MKTKREREKETYNLNITTMKQREIKSFFLFISLILLMNTQSKWKEDQSLEKKRNKSDEKAKKKLEQVWWKSDMEKKNGSEQWKLAVCVYLFLLESKCVHKMK